MPAVPLRPGTIFRGSEGEAEGCPALPACPDWAEAEEGDWNPCLPLLSPPPAKIDNGCDHCDTQQTGRGESGPVHEL